MRYFITLSYDGTNYHGWQIQPNADSVQETLQNALSTLLRQPIEIVGAGRTDTGVHASMMVCHMDFEPVQCCSMQQSRVPDNSKWCEQLVYKLNKILPQDIAVKKIEPVADDMHARFSAKSRTYHYYIHTSKDPFRRAYSWRIPYPTLDIDLMNKAAQVLMEYEDFTSFSKTNTDVKTNICHITKAEWTDYPNPPEGRGSCSYNSWMFEVKANRFLRNMVRAIVGTLVKVGRGRMTIDEMKHVIEAKDRCRAGESVPANALFLSNIEY